MSTYRARKQQQKEHQRLEERGYARGPSVPVKEVFKRLQPASQANLDKALLYLDNFYKPSTHHRRTSSTPTLGGHCQIGQVCGLHETRSLNGYLPGRNNATSMARIKKCAPPQAPQWHTNAETKKITTESARTQSNRSILIKR